MSLTVVRPVDAPITQAWGNGAYGPNGEGGHPGVDYGCPMGTPVVSCADGVVRWAGPASGFGDHAVAIWHPDLGVSSTYGHFQSHCVEVGQQVAAGQQIGEADSQGFSTGSHLHFEIRPMDAPFGGNPPNIDAEAWLQLHLNPPALPGLTDDDRKNIRFLQKVGGMPADQQTGFWGPITDAMYQTNRWKLLLLTGDPKTFPRPNPTKPSSFVKECQRAIFHFDAADQDGLWGKKTDAAFELCRLCWMGK